MCVSFDCASWCHTQAVVHGMSSQHASRHTPEVSKITLMWPSAAAAAWEPAAMRSVASMVMVKMECDLLLSCEAKESTCCGQAQNLIA